MHVLAGDDTVRAGRGDRGQVDAEVLGELADRGLGQRAALRHRLCGTGALAVQLALDRLERGSRRLLGALARAALGGTLGDAVTDQHGLPALGRLLRSGGSRLGLRRSGHRFLHGCVGGRSGRHVHRDDHLAHVDRGALGEAQLVHHPVERDRQLHRRLGGLHLAHDLAVGDGVAGLDEPLEDLRLGESLAHVGHLELAETNRCVGHRHDPSPQYASERSTASSTLSRPGRYSSSSRAGGYGTW